MAKKILFFLVLIIPLTAQQKQDTKVLFNKAVDMYRYSQYDQAYKIFSNISSDRASSYNIPAEIFKGKILIKKEKYEQAEKIFNTLKTLKDTLYRKEVLLNSSILNYNKGDYFNSVRELIELISISGRSEYYKYAKNSLDTIAINNLSSVQMQVMSDTSGSNLKPLMLILLGKSYLAEGNKQSARETFLKIMKEYSSSDLRKEAEDYYYERKTIRISKNSDPVIIMVFPGNDDSIEEIKEGIKYAVHEFNTTRDDKIGIASIDFIPGNYENIKNRILGLNTKCIMGPVYSHDVREFITEFNGIKIPVISPTATDDDLTLINEYFFQANPNFTVRAKAMAQYVYYVENKRKMGILNAIEGYSPMMAAVFSDEFRKLGGEIVVNQTFKSIEGKFDEPAAEINKMIADIEGLYIPVSDKDDINPLLTALSKYSITLPIYGNQDWFIGKWYEAFPGLTNNLIFESDYFIDYGSYNFTEFNEQYLSVTGKEAERNMLYGYDITKYFLNQAVKINAGPEIIAKKMMEDNTMTGYHNNICFDEGRVNKYVNIIRHRDGVFELVDKFKTGE